MRIAVMSDIHGNAVALDAVLNDIERQGSVDAYWVLGDIVDAGPEPVKVLQRLATLKTVRCIRGNTDRYVSIGGKDRFLCKGDPPTLNLEAAGSIAWTQGMVTQAGWLDWLSALPLETRTTLPDGTRVLGVHAAPGRDTGLGIKVGLSEDEFSLVLGDCDADLIFGGHHHQTLDARAGRKHIVNVGSVSIPFPPDLRASYVLLEADSTQYCIEHRRVEYDREGVIEAVKRLRHPGADYIISHLQGLRQSSAGIEFIQEQLRELRQRLTV